MINDPIKTVIFDLDGTLRHNLPSADDVQYGFALELGVGDQIGKQQIGARWSHYYWAQSSEFYTDMDQYGEMNPEFWENYSFRYLGALKVPQKQAIKLAKPLYLLMEKSFKPMDHIYPCVPETLQALKDAGFTLGLVSNRSNPCQDQCEELGLLRYFDFAYVAGEVNAWKPDPRIFDRALIISETSPENTLYIGDNYYADIIGARNAGLQPILLDALGVFPEADCTVIKSIQELKSILI
jgi:putative hydrolase of the HAD superfamily